MKKILLIIITLSSLTLAREDTKTYSSWAITADSSYTVYNLDLQGDSHMKAIAYDVSELTVALSRNVGSWQYGVSYRGIINEISTNSSILRTGGKDSADIDRHEFLMTVNYILNLEKIINTFFTQSTDIGKERVALNMIFYNSSLDAWNQFDIGSTFRQTYKYDTQGAKISLHYKLTPNNNQYKFWLFGGVVYTRANLKFNEYENTKVRPRYVDESVNEFGTNLGFAFTYDINYKMVFKVIGDWYNVDFGDVDVYSKNTKQVVDTAKFQENTSSIRIGLAYKF